MSNIVLIGPQNSGKSTTGKALSFILKRLQVSLDDFKDAFHDESGFDPMESSKLYQDYGIMAWYQYGKKREALLTLDALNNTRNSIIDFGAGHSEYSDRDLFEKVKSALCGNVVVLLLPSIDEEITRSVLKNRLQNDPQSWPLVEYLLNSPCNRLLANFVIYTNGKNAFEVASEIFERMNES